MTTPATGTQTITVDDAIHAKLTATAEERVTDINGALHYLLDTAPVAAADSDDDED
jgi:hypothetical protein